MCEGLLIWAGFPMYDGLPMACAVCWTSDWLARAAADLVISLNRKASKSLAVSPVGFPDTVTGTLPPGWTGNLYQRDRADSSRSPTAAKLAPSLVAFFHM